MWPPRKLTKSAKAQVIDAVTSIVNHTRTENHKMNLPVFYERTTSKNKQKNADLDELA